MWMLFFNTHIYLHIHVYAHIFVLGMCAECIFVLTFCFFFFAEDLITLVLLNPDIPTFANSVDPDQLASEEAN